MNNDALTALVIHALEDIKGLDIKVLDVTGKSTITDILVIASGGSNRQLRALAESVVEKSKEAGLIPLGVEGRPESGWVLVDLGDVVVHVMLPETRAFYGLEKFWGEESPMLAQR